MNSLAGFYHGGRFGFSHLSDTVSKHAGGIDDHLCLNTVLGSTFVITSNYAVDIAFVILKNICDRHIVHEGRAMIDCGRSQMNQQSRIVELAVIVDDSATQAVSLKRRQALKCFIVGKNTGLAEAILASKHVVQFQTDSVKR